MQIIKADVNSLIPYENNPRYNDEAVQYVAESIKQFGFKIPIVIDKENVIVAGHTRLKAAIELGMQLLRQYIPLVYHKLGSSYLPFPFYSVKRTFGIHFAISS